MEEILHQLMYILDIPVFIRVLYIQTVVGLGISEPSAVSYDYTPVNYIAMENGPFEDVLPIENGDFPLLC